MFVFWLLFFLSFKPLYQFFFKFETDWMLHSGVVVLTNTYNYLIDDSNFNLDLLKAFGSNLLKLLTHQKNKYAYYFFILLSEALALLYVLKSRSNLLLVL